MKRRKKDLLQSPNLEKLRQQAQKLDAKDALGTIDLTLTLLCEYVTLYRRTRERFLIEEIKISAEAIYAMAEQLEGGPPEGGVPSAKAARQLKRY